MANGYVNNPYIARLPVWHPMRQQYLQQQAAAHAQEQARAYSQLHPAVAANPNDPSVLFGTGPQQQPGSVGAGAGEQCWLPPKYFPAHGPNILQQFWIRLFWLIANPFIFLYRILDQTYTQLRSSIHVSTVVDGYHIVLGDRHILTAFAIENRWSLLIGLVVIVVLSVLAWFFSPKGENNTYVSSAVVYTTPVA